MSKELQFAASLIPQWNGRVKVLCENACTTGDIIEGILSVDKDTETINQVRDYVKSLVQKHGGDVRSIFYEAWQVLRQIKYVEDAASSQDIKLPSALFTIGKGDCKSYSIFIAAICKVLGIDYAFRFTNYSISAGKEARHVYVVAYPSGQQIIIDGVWTKFDHEKPYNWKKDIMNKVRRIGKIAGGDQKSRSGKRSTSSNYTPVHNGKPQTVPTTTRTQTAGRTQSTTKSGYKIYENPFLMDDDTFYIYMGLKGQARKEKGYSPNYDESSAHRYAIAKLKQYVEGSGRIVPSRELAAIIGKDRADRKHVLNVYDFFQSIDFQADYAAIGFLYIFINSPSLLGRMPEIVKRKRLKMEKLSIDFCSELHISTADWMLYLKKRIVQNPEYGFKTPEQIISAFAKEAGLFNFGGDGSSKSRGNSIGAIAEVLMMIVKALPAILALISVFTELFGKKPEPPKQEDIPNPETDFQDMIITNPNDPIIQPKPEDYGNKSTSKGGSKLFLYSGLGLLAYAMSK